MESPRVASEVGPAFAGTAVSPGLPGRVEKGPHYVPADPAVVERQRTSALLKTTSAHSSKLAETDQANLREPVPTEHHSVRALHPTPAPEEIPRKYRYAAEKPDDLLQQAHSNASPCLLSTGTPPDPETEEKRHEAGQRSPTRLPRCLEASSSVKPTCEHIAEAGQFENPEKLNGHVVFREKQRRATNGEPGVNALSSPDALWPLTASFTTPTALPSRDLAVVPASEKYAKANEVVANVHGDLFSKISLSEKSHELQSPHLHTRCKDTAQGPGPDKSLEPLQQQHETYPPCSIQTELPQVHKRDMDLRREISASCAEHFFKGVSNFRLCFNSTYEGQLRSPTVLATDLPLTGQQSFPSVGDTIFLTGSKDAEPNRSFLLYHDTSNSKRAQEPKERPPELYIASTDHDYVEEAVKVDRGESVAAGSADLHKAPHASKYQGNYTELISGFFGLQMPHRNTGEKSRSCLIESAHSDPSHGACCCIRRESASGLYQETESYEKSPPAAGASGTTLKSPPAERGQTAQTRSVTPLVRTECSAADDCAQADLQDYRTWAQGARVHCPPDLLLSLDSDSNHIMKSGDNGTQHSLCAVLQTEKKGSSISSFSTGLSPALTRNGPALSTPLRSVKHDTNMPNDESDTFLFNGNTLYRGATDELESPFNGAETATNRPAATRDGIITSSAPAPSKFTVLEHAPRWLAENIASHPTLSCTCPEDQLQARKDQSEERLQHIQRNEPHKVPHELSRQISSSGQDEFRAYSQEHPHGREKASVSSILLEGTSSNRQQRTTTFLAAPGSLTEKDTADRSVEGGSRMSQAYSRALPLVPPEEHSYPSCALFNSLAQEAAVSIVNVHPVAPSDVSLLCHPSCKQTMLSTPEHSARRHERGDMDTVPIIAGGTCIERNSEAATNTATPDARFRAVPELIVPDIEQNCLTSAIRMVPEDVRRPKELKENPAQNSHMGVPDTPGVFSSFGTRDTADAGSRAGSARNSLLCCETAVSPGRASGHCNLQHVQSLFKALVPATVAEEVSSDSAPRPSARRTRPLLNAERPLCSTTTVANGALAGGLRRTVDSDCAPTGNCNAIASNRNNSTWCSEDYFEQSNKGEDAKNSNGVQASVGALANSVGDSFASPAKLSDTELLQIYEAYTAVCGGVSLVDPERHCVVDSSNSNATGLLGSARTSLPPRTEVQFQNVAAITCPESPYGGTTGEHLVATKPIPSVGRALLIDESPPSEEHAGLHDHSSSAAISTTLAAISMLELLAFLPAVQGDSTGGRPAGHATRAHPGEVKAAATWPGAGRRRSTEKPMMACSSDLCTSTRKVSSFLEDRITRGVPTFPMKGRKLDGQHQVIHKYASKDSTTIAHRANCNVVQDSESSAALGTLNNTSHIGMPTNLGDPVQPLQPLQPDTKGNGVVVWPPACPASRPLALCSNAVLSAGNSIPTAKGGQLKAAEAVDAADDGAARSDRSILCAVDKSRNLLQQPAQPKLIMSTAHLFNSLATNSGTTLSKTEVPSRNTQEGTSEAQQRFSIGSVSPAPGPLNANFFRGDARPPHKTPAASGETGTCLDYARAQWICTQNSSNWPALLPPCDRVAHSGISPCVVGSRQQNHQEMSSVHAERSCISCNGLSARRSRDLSVETTQRLIRIDDVGALENHQQSGEPTSEMSDAGTPASGNADAATYPVGAKTASFPDQQRSKLSCVDEGIRKLADGVVLRDLLYEAVNILEDASPSMRAPPFSKRSQPVSSNTVRLTCETVTVADDGHGAAPSAEAIFSPVTQVSKDAEGNSNEVFDTVPSLPERSLEQNEEHVQQQQRQERDQPEMSRWHQQQGPKLEHHGQTRRQFPDGAVPLPSTGSFGRWMLPKTTHLPERQDVVSCKNHGQPVARPNPGKLPTTRDAAQTSATPSGSKKVLPFTRTCSRGLPPYNNQRRGGSPTRQKHEALLTRERRHLGGDARTRRPFESSRPDKTSATSSFRSTLVKYPTSAVKHEVQAQLYQKHSRLLQPATSAVFSPAAARGTSVELSLSYTLPSGFPCNASNVAPHPPPPPPPPAPSLNTTAYCKAKIDTENRLLPSTESGASSTSVLASLDDLVEKTREISWLHVLQGMLEQQARRGGGTVSEAIAAALAVADATAHGPIMTADAPISKQEGSAAPLEVTQTVHSSPTKRDPNGGSSTAGEFATTIAEAGNEDMQTQLQNSVQRLPTRLVKRVANSVSGSAGPAGHECWAASLAAPAPRLSSACSPVQPGALFQTAPTTADACWSLTESSLLHWRKLRGLEEVCVNTSATKAVTHVLPKTQVSKEGEKRTEAAEEITSVAGTSTKLGLKHVTAAQDPSELNRRQEVDATRRSAVGETTDCAVESAAEQQGVQENVSRERMKVEEATLWGENGEQQRLGISEGQQARRRPPRPSKRQRVLIRALTYVKQRLKTLECEVLPLVAPEPLGQTTALPNSDSKHRNHRYA